MSQNEKDKKDNHNEDKKEKGVHKSVKEDKKKRIVHGSQEIKKEPRKKGQQKRKATITTAELEAKYNLQDVEIIQLKEDNIKMKQAEEKRRLRDIEE